QHISSQSKLKLKEVLFKISDKMYEESRITLANVYSDDYYNELIYLNSNQLLIEQNNELQFFHQTFYEYCFAKQFVENGGILEVYILKHDQSLYIRSIIKLVVEYLRQYDPGRYFSTIKHILMSSEYRFHIKTLLITELALAQNPIDKVKDFVLEV